MGGITYIEVNYDARWVENALANLQGFSWYFEWGMYIFLIAALGILFWIFFDSITKKKDQKALVPRILSMVGFFAIIPSFIFRFIGTADGVVTLVRLNAENPVIYYPGPIFYNVGMLTNGYGPAIAVIGLIGIIISIAAIVIYASTVQRAKPSTEFVQAFDNRMANLESKVASSGNQYGAAGVPFSGSTPSASKSDAAQTIFDRPPHAATIIDNPKTGDTIVIRTKDGKSSTVDLPGEDVIVGRDKGSFVVLEDGKVSGKHAKLHYDSGSWAITDLGSTNGSYLNGVKIEGRQALSNGDELRFGDTTVVLVSAR